MAWVQSKELLKEWTRQQRCIVCNNRNVRCDDCRVILPEQKVTGFEKMKFNEFNKRAFQQPTLNGGE